MVSQRPLAILAAYNEFDVIEEAVLDLLEQDCDLALIDNWSTDGTFERMQALAESHPTLIHLERYPADAPSAVWDWRSMLRRKEEIAFEHPGRWIIHTDADELRRPPLPGKTLRTAFAALSSGPWNRVNFKMLVFRPTQGEVFTRMRDMRFFEYGNRPGHFIQKKAWLQGHQRVDLASSGGHEAIFEGAVDNPEEFILMHYPLRSREQAIRKIAERRARFSAEERAMGWHVQYADHPPDNPFVWERAKLHQWKDMGNKIDALPPQR
jgi:hypothetical protein